MENEENEKKKRGRPKRPHKEEDSAEKKLEPLKIASGRIADMLCSLSGEEELFVSDPDGGAKRRLDTKTLKEFSSVIKEICSVICELNGISLERDAGSAGGQILIEFDGGISECGE